MCVYIYVYIYIDPTLMEPASVLLLTKPGREAFGKSGASVSSRDEFRDVRSDLLRVQEICGIFCIAVSV